MPTATDLAQLERAADNLRTAGSMGRESVACGAFAAYFWPHSDDDLLGFATPAGAAPADWDTEIAALKELFEGRGRRLRLEFFRELYPALPDALERAGLTCEKSAPALVLGRKELRPQLRATGGSYHNVTAAELGPFLDAHNRAFGMAPERARDWEPVIAEGLDSGAALAAATYVDDRPIAGAMIELGGGVGELCGVWTLPEHRGRGLASDLCSRLLLDFFVAGHDLAWLSAGDASWTIYRRLGFRPVGTQLNYGLRP
jgi:ribosomal protein S18 acetylase RimI-like enzyme